MIQVTMRFRWVMMLLCVMGGLLPVTANAGSFEDGWLVYQKGDFYGARQIWLPLAEDGDARAQFNIGLMFDEGRGLEQDRAQALKWWGRAATGGKIKQAGWSEEFTLNMIRAAVKV